MSDQDMLFGSSGRLRYSSQVGEKLIVEVDPEISDYYRSLLPLCMRVKRQRYAPHISVLREEYVESEKWILHQDREINFEYSGFIYYNETYVWLGVSSIQLEELRKELGLTPHNLITRSPDGAQKFHITIGNMKEA